MDDILLAIALIVAIAGTYISAVNMSVPMNDNDKERWGFGDDDEDTDL